MCTSPIQMTEVERVQGGSGQAEQVVGPEFSPLSEAQKDRYEKGGHSSTATVQITLSLSFGGTSVQRAEEGPALSRHVQPCGGTLRRGGRDGRCPVPAPERRCGGALGSARPGCGLGEQKRLRPSPRARYLAEAEVKKGKTSLLQREGSSRSPAGPGVAGLGGSRPAPGLRAGGRRPFLPPATPRPAGQAAPAVRSAAGAGGRARRRRRGGGVGGGGRGGGARAARRAGPEVG